MFVVAKKEGQQQEDQERKYIECKKRIELFSKNENDLKVVEEFYEDALRCVGSYPSDD